MQFTALLQIAAHALGDDVGRPVRAALAQLHRVSDGQLLALTAIEALVILASLDALQQRRLCHNTS